MQTEQQGKIRLTIALAFIQVWQITRAILRTNWQQNFRIQPSFRLHVREPIAVPERPVQVRYGM